MGTVTDHGWRGLSLSALTGADIGEQMVYDTSERGPTETSPGSSSFAGSFDLPAEEGQLEAAGEAEGLFR